MCTVSWLDDRAGGYVLLFNRDERRSRAPALPPARMATADGVPFLAPIDGAAGGTWLGVNADGVTVGLLNHYAAEAQREAAAQPSSDQPSSDPPSAALPSPPRAQPPSRGELVLALLGARSVAEVIERLADDGGSSAYRPFEVVALDAGGDRARATWDGRRLSVARAEAVAAPVSSSGFDAAGVIAARAATFAGLVGAEPSAPPTPDPDAGARLDRPARVARLEAFHRSHLPARGAYSVCMHRPDARTVSLTLVGVEHDAVWMRYGAGPACRAVLGPALRLRRS